MPDMVEIQEFEGEVQKNRRGGFLLTKMLTERSVRRYAYKLGYQLHKKRGGYCLVHVHTEVVMVGMNYSADLADVAYYLHCCDREWDEPYLDGRGLRFYSPEDLYREADWSDAAPVVATNTPPAEA